MEIKKNKSKYFRWGVTLLCVVIASIIISVIFTNLTGFFNVINDAIQIASPLIYGALFSYLLNPLVKLVERLLLPWLVKKLKKPQKAERLSRIVGIIAALLVGGFVVYGLFSLVLPQLYETISSIVNNLPEYFRTIEAWSLKILADHPEVRDYVNSSMNMIYKYVQDWLSESLLNNVQTVMVSLTTSVVAVIKEIVSILIGLVISVYVLASKDTFLAQTKKLIVAWFRPKTADRIFYVGRETHRIFSGFIIGKIIDSLIIGILCYIGMRILNLPFAMLVSVIIGVTNIIPFFGPIIGIVPSAVLILLVSPLKMLYFVIFAVILQQVDGNIIGPRILGDSIGISGFWVLISITLAGNLFGFGGMLLGVPVFAVIYALVKEGMVKVLRKKKLPTDSESYRTIDCVEDLQSVSEPAALEET